MASKTMTGGSSPPRPAIIGRWSMWIGPWSAKPKEWVRLPSDRPNEVKIMTIQKVIKIIGICRLQEFYRFMEGQTVSMNKDGSINYYKQDVDNFLRKKEDRFFD